VLAHVFIAVERIVSNQERADADVLIVPRIGHIRWDQTRRSNELVECGYRAGLEAIAEIRAVIGQGAKVGIRPEKGGRLQGLFENLPVKNFAPHWSF
jgi:hypothetical protein